MAYYKDIREYIEALDKAGKLRRVHRQINKDTELMPLVRLQYQGLPEEQRTAFLFDNIVGIKGNKYKGSVAIGALAGSEEIYAIGMQCKPSEITEKRAKAEQHPIPPKLVNSGPCQEEVHVGANLLEHGGLAEFPVPISTPGYDPAPCLTAPYWFSKDPDSGINNIGTYRVLFKSPTKTGLDVSRATQGIAIHWNKAREKCQPLQAAIVLGGPPCIGYVSVTSYPLDCDELTMAGAIAGAPIEVVKCKTVDLEVPAYSEIVIEGELNTEELELEGPFGESIGYMSLTQPRPYFTVKCITHRKDPVYLGFISQFQPSESSKIKRLGNEAGIFRHLRYELGMDKVTKVSMAETSDSTYFTVIQLKGASHAEVWAALEEQVKFKRGGKIIIAVDDDIDPNDFDMLTWALSMRFQPHRDTKIITRPAHSLTDISLAPSPEMVRLREMKVPDMPPSSVMLMDATRKWPYPPVSLPKREYMDKAIKIWQELGYPVLKMKEPYWGENLGYWFEEDEKKAAWAMQGEYFKTGELQETQKRPGGPHLCLWEIEKAQGKKKEGKGKNK